MSKKINIGQNIALANLLKYAETAVTAEGVTYYRFPCWFQQLPDDFIFIIHMDPPKDLLTFITKAGLGGENPQIKKPEL